MSGPVLEAIDITARRGGRVVFEGVHLEVQEGELLVVTGEAGSGKTTLAETLADIERPTAGVVLCRGAPVSATGAVGFVPQQQQFVSTLTALETVELPLQWAGLKPGTVRARATRWLVATGLEPCADRLIGTLSGGQRQRVAVARCLATDSSVLIMDEPTSELDEQSRRMVLQLLREELATGRAAVVVSNEPELLDGTVARYELAPRWGSEG